MDFQKSLLDDLMSAYVEVDHMEFWDDKVCKHYLVDFCPYQLFTNTKADRGQCDKVHNDRLRQRYQSSPDKHKYPYEADFYDHLNRLIRDLDRKIRNENIKLSIQAGDGKTQEMLEDERKEKIIKLDEEIKTCLEKIEEAGEEGRVQEAQELTERKELLEQELDKVKNNQDPVPLGDKGMTVCTTCGGKLATGDNSRDRLDSHFAGKQHSGYAKIRETLDRHKSSRSHGSDRDYGRGRRDSRDRHDKSRDRDYRRSHSDRDGGHRDRERDYRRRSRDRRGGGNEDDWDREAQRYSSSYRRHNADTGSRRSRSRSPRRGRHD